MQPETPRAMPGRMTLEDLTDTAGFFAPLAADAWGNCRAPFDAHIARLSAELDADVYDLAVSQWERAGWQDCTFVAEDKIVRLDAGGGSHMERLEREWRRRKAMGFLQGINPLTDTLRAVRQIFVTDMGKTVVMTRTAENGKAVVAVAFIGTTSKIGDWLSNLKCKNANGLHAGFDALATQFEAQAGRIPLPELAAALGEESLTLEDVLTECQKTDGRFALWFSGHSQGGAVTQACVHHLMERGVRPENLRAYTFASPTVASCHPSLRPGDDPIYNIVNDDDLITRTGAQVRLGLDCVYHPDEAFRARYYALSEKHEAYDRMLETVGGLRDFPQTVAFSAALMELFGRSDADDAMRAFFNGCVPHLSLLYKMSLTRLEIADFVKERLLRGYQSLAGEEMDEALCAGYASRVEECIHAFGPKESAEALMLCIFAPHHIRLKHARGPLAPYVAIVRRCLPELVTACWRGDAPQLEYQPRPAMLPSAPEEETPPDL